MSEKTIRLLKVQVQAAIETENGPMPVRIVDAKNWPREARETKVVFLCTPTYVIDDGKHLVENEGQAIAVSADDLAKFPSRLARQATKLEAEMNGKP